MDYSIAVLPGDGVGPEVTAEAVKVLRAVGRRFGHRFDLGYGRIGGNSIDEFGTPLPDETVELCEGSDAILFGAVGGPKWDDPRADVRPEDGILTMRKSLGLFAKHSARKDIPRHHQLQPGEGGAPRGGGRRRAARVDGRPLLR